MSKTILAEVEGFTPVIDCIVRDTSPTTALVFGRMWRYCQMKNGVCQASLDTIADGIGMSPRTVFDHIQVLERNGYLEDMTPDLKNRPHTYRDTGKAGLHIGVFGMQNLQREKDASMQDSQGTLQNLQGTMQNLQPDVAESADEDSTKKEINKPIRDETAFKYWQTIDEYLRSEMPRSLHKYLDGCVPLQWEGSTLTVQAQDAEWLDQHCGKLAKRFLVGITQGGAVEFVA